MSSIPTLYIFGGLPASGKSTLSVHLAKSIGAVYIKIDSIEEAILSCGNFIGPEGYEAAYKIADDNLCNGLSVIADSVNSIHLTRNAWKKVAQNRGLKSIEIKVVCSDENEHKQRLEDRSLKTSNIRKLTWEEVKNREFDTWESSNTFNTAGETPDDSCQRFEKEIKTYK